MKYIFAKEVTDELIARVNQLTAETQPKWGKMDVAQMMAHCSVAYDMAFTEGKYKKLTGFKKWLVSLLAKNMVVSEKPYKKNSRTAPEFLIVDEKEFNTEKNSLVKHVQTAFDKGESFFDGKESNSFGALTAKEWSNLFYKHLDHHLTQFGV